MTHFSVCTPIIKQCMTVQERDCKIQDPYYLAVFNTGLIFGPSHGDKDLVWGGFVLFSWTYVMAGWNVKYSGAYIPIGICEMN